MVSNTMMLIVHCFLLFAVLQFVVITGYYASLRLAKNNKQSALNTIQLRFLGSIFPDGVNLSGLLAEKMTSQ